MEGQHCLREGLRRTRGRQARARSTPTPCSSSRRCPKSVGRDGRGARGCRRARCPGTPHALPAEVRPRRPHVTRERDDRRHVRHRSGLREHAGDQLGTSDSARRRCCASCAWKLGSFRDVYAYTNFGADAAVAVANAAGLDWASLSQRDILQPARHGVDELAPSTTSRTRTRAVTHRLLNGVCVADTVRQPDAESPAAGVSSLGARRAKWLTMVLHSGPVRRAADRPARRLSVMRRRPRMISSRRRRRSPGAAASTATGSTSTRRRPWAPAVALAARSRPVPPPASSRCRASTSASSSSPTGRRSAPPRRSRNVLRPRAERLAHPSTGGRSTDAYTFSPADGRPGRAQAPSDQPGAEPARISSYVGTCQRLLRRGARLLVAERAVATARSQPTTLPAAALGGDRFTFMPTGESAMTGRSRSPTSGAALGPHHADARFYNTDSRGHVIVSASSGADLLPQAAPASSGTTSGVAVAVRRRQAPPHQQQGGDDAEDHSHIASRRAHR